MDINFFFEDIDEIDLTTDVNKHWIAECIKAKNKEIGDLNFIFCSDSYLLELNKTHLNHDYYTDIITFDYCESNIISGDIYISIDRVGGNAKEFKQEFDIELHRVMIHGVLHLLGLDDHSEEEKKQMRSAEDACLATYAGLN